MAVIRDGQNTLNVRMHRHGRRQRPVRLQLVKEPPKDGATER
jgi:hypothetical protein